VAQIKKNFLFLQAEIESRVLAVCKAFDKISADKVLYRFHILTEFLKGGAFSSFVLYGTYRYGTSHIYAFNPSEN
jgi:hypothetical protein